MGAIVVAGSVCPKPITDLDPIWNGVAGVFLMCRVGAPMSTDLEAPPGEKTGRCGVRSDQPKVERADRARISLDALGINVAPCAAKRRSRWRRSTVSAFEILERMLRL